MVIELRPSEECWESKGHAREKHYAYCFFEPYGKDNKVNQRVGTQEGRHAVQHKLLGFFKRYE